MWIIIAFDIPTDSDTGKAAYREFKKFLKQDGYQMMQYSVYIRFTGNTANTEKHLKRVKKCIPFAGEVRVIRITDFQFGKMEVFYCGNKEETEKSLPHFIDI